MNTKEACSILGINVGASDTELSKAWKKIAKACHPDSGGSEDAFKKANEAYQHLKKHGTSDLNPYNDIFEGSYNNYPGFANFHINFQNIFYDSFVNNNVGRRVPLENIYDHVSISFAEAVLGTSRNVSFFRSKRCTKCCGVGTIFNGKTRTVCPDCRGVCTADVEEHLKVNIPPGVKDNAKIKISGKGDNNSDAYIKVSVSGVDNMALDGKDVVSLMPLTMLECLEGTVKTAKTVRGEIRVKIPPKVRHRDSVRVKGHGVPPDGSHIFIVEMEYPEDVGPLIEALREDGYK